MASPGHPFPKCGFMFGKVLAVVPLLALAGCLTESAPAPTDTGIPWELAEVRRKTISALTYEVRLSIPSERARPIEGETIVRFAWNDGSKRDVVLDFLEPSTRVRSVEANGATVLWRPENDHVVIPQTALRPGTNEVKLVYTAGDEALNRSDDFLYALFVPDRHHFSLPVFDQPNLKARWRLTLEMPQGWVAVGNGAEEVGEARPVAGTGPRRIYTFAETKPIAPYLFAFVAGKFQVEESDQDGRRMRMFHRETDAARVARNREQIFALHRTALAWLEDYTGIPYPFDKFDFVLIPAFQYGGMEHPGAILYSADGILLDESATQSDYLDRATTIAHETSHMWFGDLVTMNWFDDVWTKEVFANFLAAKIVKPAFPDVDHDLRFLVQHYPSAYAVDRTKGTNPIQQPLENLKDAGSLYGSIIYDKAPIVMRQLEGLVGEDGLRDGLREYLTKYSYGNATWQQLIEILDDHTSQDLEGWSEAWVEESGRPTIRVTREITDLLGTRVNIRAEDPDKQGRAWPQTLDVAIPEGDAIRIRPVDLTGANATFDLTGPEPAWILPNGGGFEYGRFVLDDQSRTALLAGVGDITEGRVRGAAWVTLWDAVLDGEIPPERFLERVLACLPTEPDEQVTQLLLSYLQTSYWRLLPSVERGRRGPGVERVVWKGAREAKTSTLRAAYFAAWRNLVETSDGIDRMKRIWAGTEASPVPLAEPDRTRLAATLALLEVDGWRQLLEDEEAKIQNPDRKARFAFLRPALSADPADRERFFSSLADPANREQEPWVLDALYYLNHPRRADQAQRFIEPALGLMEEIQHTGDIFFPGAWIQNVLWGHTSPEAAEAVRAFLAARPDYPAQLRLKILQASDMVERSARIVYGWGG